MIPSLSIEELNRRLKNKYDADERRIIGIMFARYQITLVKDVIEQCYLYWHDNSGREFDVFWAGYGEYLREEDQTTAKRILDFPDNEKHIYFDRDAFVSCKNAANKFIKPAYRDRFELLLVNYHDGQLHFPENIRIDLEENLDAYFGSIREIMEYITEQCRSEYDIVSLHRKMLAKNLWSKIKGVKISDFVSTVASFL